MIRTIREGDRWRLQTAAIALEQPQTGQRVLLLSMIHIGRPDYYARLAALVEEHPGTVLFEGVGELSPEEQAALPEEERRVYAGLASLNAGYRRIAAALGLVAQPDAMPKPRPGWVRADLPVRELLRRWVAGRLPLVPLMDQAGQALESALARRVTRLLLLQEPWILSVFRLVKGISPNLGRLTGLLVDERNAAALATFDTLAGPAAQDVLITYGAGHVPGLLAGFRTRGYRVRHQDWYTAHEERIPYTDLLDRAAPIFAQRGSKGAGSGE